MLYIVHSGGGKTSRNTVNKALLFSYKGGKKKWLYNNISYDNYLTINDAMPKTFPFEIFIDTYMYMCVNEYGRDWWPVTCACSGGGQIQNAHKQFKYTW